ncbi:MAG: VapC toxin family PIN domain ribonuclease [Pseudomonas sp.]
MGGVLVDTSIWVDHFRKGNDGLIKLISLDLVVTHPMVVAEIACGTPPAPRSSTLLYISLLKPCNQASLNEVMAFIENEKLYGLGCGLVDLTLLASTLITPGTQLWTLDKRLADLAERFGVAHRTSIH